MGKMYTTSGVNLEEANKLNNKISGLNRNSGSFAGEVDFNGIKILNCCDGIGSKIIPLYEKKLYNTIAIDLIAANLNDMVTKNAKAVGFSDYIAVNKLDSDAVSQIIKELKNELSKYDCELLGGETSEIPNLVKDGKIDICGFAIGVRENTVAEPILRGDVIVALKSSGVHANGFSIIRKLFLEDLLSSDDFEKCLCPSFVYYNEIRTLWQNGLIKSGANITGGGIFSNLKRIIPEGLELDINIANIPSMRIFEKLKKIIGDEIFDVFNCGVGFCIVAREEYFNEIMKVCSQYEPFILGRII